jgi:hypothetical protein
MDGLTKVRQKGLKVSMFSTRNERLICGRLISIATYYRTNTHLRVKRCCRVKLYELNKEACYNTPRL